MSLKNILAYLLCGVAFADFGGAMAAVKSTKVSKQSAIQNGTTVRTRLTATGLYDQACYDAYYGCMDQFCITDNSNGGSCACSDDNAKYESQLSEIQSMMDEAARIRTEDVERVKAGADADIVFTGTRKYDENGNIMSAGELTAAEKKAQARQSLMALFENDTTDDEDIWDSEISTVADKTGAALFAAAQELCTAQIPAKCKKDLNFLTQLYSRQIVSDCKGFENSLTTQMATAKQDLAAAQAEVRDALRESFESANKYDLGTCMVEFKKCMQTDDACGTDWENCVSTIAAENMQNNTAVSTASTKVATVNTYDITASTMEILDSKRTICEKVLDNCVAVRDQVWPAFLREAAPTIKLAETKMESKFRQSCLTNISNCIQTACKDDIAGKGVATMDACLSRPDMARSFCKVEIDPCERMEPLIWGYVTDKLAAMRVDACTQEVKDCFTADTRCGSEFQNCIGMDYDFIHDICPIDSLVVCKANNPSFSMDDLDSMLMGLYLNIDNAALNQCQDLVDTKMTEICGSTTDCNKFAADDTIGTGSLRSQKDGTIYRVTGMISFGSIKMGDATGRVIDNGDGTTTKLGAGQIGVDEYLAQIRSRNANVANADGIISSIEEELNNIAGTINRTISLIEQDPEIQYCINGRNLSQITGQANQKTTARFPNLLNSVKMQIAVSALRQAQDNYNAKLNSEIAAATKNASADIAQYVCQMLPMNGGATYSADVKTTLAQPYAISYDVGAGLDNSMLAQGGHSTSNVSGTAALSNSANAGATKFSEGAATVLTLGLNQLTGANNHVTIELPSGTREMWSVFNRDTRVCHYCTSTVTKSCNSVSKRDFWALGPRMNCRVQNQTQLRSARI